MKTTIVDNAAFASATDRKKRILVAQDVIAQVRADKYVPQTGIYAEFTGTPLRSHKPGFTLSRPVAPHELLKREEAACVCCGIGSMFVSSCSLSRSTSSLFMLSPLTYTNALRDLFGSKQLALIEIAFEQWDHDRYVSNRVDDVSVTEAERAQAERFGLRYEDDTQRLLAIMENIIANGGRFTPVKKRKKAKVKAHAAAQAPVKQPVKARAQRVQQRLHVSATGGTVLV